MATKTLGTTLTTSLTAVQFLPGYGSGMSASDIAAMSIGIKNDLILSHPIVSEAFSSNGKLYIPNRGVLTMLPGDWIGFDATTGWPILVAKNAITSGPWTHS